MIKIKIIQLFLISDHAKGYSQHWAHLTFHLWSIQGWSHQHFHDMINDITGQSGTQRPGRFFLWRLFLTVHCSLVNNLLTTALCHRLTLVFPRRDDRKWINPAQDKLESISNTTGSCVWEGRKEARMVGLWMFYTNASLHKTNNQCHYPLKMEHRELWRRHSN